MAPAKYWSLYLLFVAVETTAEIVEDMAAIQKTTTNPTATLHRAEEAEVTKDGVAEVIMIGKVAVTVRGPDDVGDIRALEEEELEILIMMGEDLLQPTIIQTNRILHPGLMVKL